MANNLIVAIGGTAILAKSYAILMMPMKQTGHEMPTTCSSVSLQQTFMALPLF